MVDISARVKAANEHMANRIGQTITYKRYCKESYNPETGADIIYFEQTAFTAIPLSVSGREIESSGGRTRSGDIAFTFRKDEWTDHSDYEYLTFTSGSAQFTAGETLTGATSGATATVVNEYLDSGTYAGSDGDGAVWISGITGTFVAENLNGSVSGNNCATISGDSVTGGTDRLEPHPKDIIVYNGYNYGLDLENGKMLWGLDATTTLYRVLSRRMG